MAKTDRNYHRCGLLGPSTSWVYPGLSANGVYSFIVKAMNGENIETAFLQHVPLILLPEKYRPLR